jgi:hypothetical protein
VEQALPELRIDIGAGPDSDDEELARLSVELREELLELDVDSVSRAAQTPPPKGAKGLDAGTAGTLLVSLSDSAVIVALIGLVQSWVTRGRGRKATVRIGKDTLEVTGISAEDQAKIIASWLDHHGR